MTEDNTGPEKPVGDDSNELPKQFSGPLWDPSSFQYLGPDPDQRSSQRRPEQDEQLVLAATARVESTLSKIDLQAKLQALKEAKENSISRVAFAARLAPIFLVFGLSLIASVIFNLAKSSSLILSSPLAFSSTSVALASGAALIYVAHWLRTAYWAAVRKANDRFELRREHLEQLTSISRLVRGTPARRRQ